MVSRLPGIALDTRLGFLLIWAAFGCFKPCFAEARFALVIGNGGYANAPLSIPYLDANAMEEKLIKVGYKARKVTDQSQRNFNREIGEFVEDQFGSCIDTLRANLIRARIYSNLRTKAQNYGISRSSKLNSPSTPQHRCMYPTTRTSNFLRSVGMPLNTM